MEFKIEYDFFEKHGYMRFDNIGETVNFITFLVKLEIPFRVCFADNGDFSALISDMRDDGR